ncbi:MAG TPA: hypothetical protein VGJ37_18510 [Pyrinomonadaceae bacterium]|jgi:hypothetical protein
MLRTLSLLFLLLCSAALTNGQVFPPPEGKMETQYDRFTDVRTEMLYRVQVGHREPEYDFQNLYLTVGARFLSSSSSSKPPDYVAMIFTSWSLWDNQYLGPTRLYAIIDGERVTYEPFVLAEREVINGKHVITIGGRITYKQFQQITNGKTVEMRLGDFEFRLSEPVLKTLREYASRAAPYLRDQ